MTESQSKFGPVRNLWLLASFWMILLAASCTSRSTNVILRLGTTTSVEDSGLLIFLLEDFEREYRVEVEVIAVGTGQAIALGERGDVDVIIVHAPRLEQEFVGAGYGLQRYDLMVNDFIIVGPKDDPARVSEANSAAKALFKIAVSRAVFVSRGDSSGTHIREIELWDQAGIKPSAADDWYYSIGQGMGATLNFTNELEGYTLSDRGTFLSHGSNLSNLEVLFGGKSFDENSDSLLRNYYSIIPINPIAHPKVNSSLAKDFVTWITSDSTQAKILSFGQEQYGQPLFYPNSEEWMTAALRSSSEFGGIPLVNLEDSEKDDDLIAIFQGDTKFIEIIILTIQVSGSALILASFTGIPLGAYLGLAEFRGKRLIQLVIYTGMGLPPVVVGLAAFLFLSNNGPLGWLDWLFTPLGMILAQSILAFPLATGLTASAVKAVSSDLILQIRSLGATPIQERWTILRQARMGVIAAILAAFGRIISEVGAVMLVGGNIAGSTRVLSTAIVLETRQGNFELAVALGLILLGVALISNALVLRFGGRWQG